MPKMESVNKLFRKFLRSKLLQCLFAMSVLALVYIAYRSQQNNSFSSMSERYRNSTGNKLTKEGKDSLLSVSNKNTGPVSVDVLITFTKAEYNEELQTKFRTCVTSLFHFASVHVKLHILGDDASRSIASKILSESVGKSKFTLHHLDVENLAKKAHEVVADMQTHFSFKPGAYYSDSLFFLSIVAGRVLPDFKQVIMLDADLKFNADIKNLFDEFNKFSESNIIGIARENQPVYRHTFHMYRGANKGTRVGEPPPNGLTGFNSGVLLLDVEKMSHSKTYSSLLSPESVKRLTEKYTFKGHLGDQDFFTLISLEHEELFHVLPCSWNRQLCIWWRDNGYSDVFEEYFRCDGRINIYHGNCNTAIPKLEWEI